MPVTMLKLSFVRILLIAGIGIQISIVKQKGGLSGKILKMLLAVLLLTTQVISLIMASMQKR